MNRQRLIIAAFFIPLFVGVLAIRSYAQSDGDPNADSSTADASTPVEDTTDPDESDLSEGETKTAGDSGKYAALLASLTIFVLAVFVGFEVITKVPPTLHTPLMSGSNAISGITIVGALLATGFGENWFVSFVGMIALVLATINVVGGFLVTHRMLEMFKKKK